MAFVLRELFKENTYVEMDYPSGMRSCPDGLRYRQDGQLVVRLFGNVAEFVVRCVGQLRHVRFRKLVVQQPEQQRQFVRHVVRFVFQRYLRQLLKPAGRKRNFAGRPGHTRQLKPHKRQRLYLEVIVSSVCCARTAQRSVDCA
jgi:hypothetical protein